jgi:adenylate cyclase
MVRLQNWIFHAASNIAFSLMKRTAVYRGADKLRALVASCLIVGLVLALAFSTGWRSQQAEFGDFLVKLAPKPVLPVGVEFVGIDASSLNLDQLSPEQIAASPSLTAMKAGFPWSRAVYAEAIEKLLNAGARLVFLDLVFANPREGDAELRVSLEKYGDKVVILSTFAEDVSGGGQNIGRYQPPSDTLLGSKPLHVGFSSFWREDGQVVREAPMRLKQPGSDKPVIAAAATMLSLLAGADKVEVLPDQAAFIPGMGVLQEEMRPIWQLFDPVTWQYNLKNGDVFRDKAVAIGAYFPDAHDEFLTPAGPMPGVAMHMGLLASAWQGAFYTRPGPLVQGVAALLASLLALAVALLCRHIIPRSLVYVLGVVLIVAGGVAALTWLHFQVPLLPLLSGFLVGGVATLVVDLVAEGRARHRARRMLESYFSPDLAREMLDRRDSFLQSVGGSRREVTVLVSDLRGFTTLAESVEPAELIAELNDYLGRMTALIFESGGGVDKFLGDGILAVWGTMEERSEDLSSAPALACAQKMLLGLQELNVTRVAAGKPEWRLGIGIHRGPVIFGNVGSPQKMELTVIGDTVNLASRTESLNKSYGLEILFTRSVRDHSGSAAEASRSVDRIRVVGRSRPVDLFTIWDPAVPPDERLAHEQAVELYRGGDFPGALFAFQSLEAGRLGDMLYPLYAGRCIEWIKKPPEQAWDGISQAKSK